MKTVMPPDPGPALTLGAWLQQHRSAPPNIVATNTLDHFLDLQLLAGHVLGLSRSQILTNNKRQLASGERESLEPLVSQLHQGIPLAYLVGQKEFWSLAFAVNNDVLIPRPDTELLVELVLAQLQSMAPQPTGRRVLELGTGSGAISVALAHQWLQAPNNNRCEFTATDISQPALTVAQANAQTHGVSINFVQCHWLAAISGPVDLLVSNPPYIAANDPHLDTLGFEPRPALVGGHDGLDAYRDIVHNAAQRMTPGGWIFLEHGYDQRVAVTDLLTQGGFVNIVSHKDLADNDRVTQAQHFRS